jgi:hypothetical protein
MFLPFFAARAVERYHLHTICPLIQPHAATTTATTSASTTAATDSTCMPVSLLVHGAVLPQASGSTLRPPHEAVAPTSTVRARFGIISVPTHIGVSIGVGVSKTRRGVIMRNVGNSKEENKSQHRKYRLSVCVPWGITLHLVAVVNACVHRHHLGPLDEAKGGQRLFVGSRVLGEKSGRERKRDREREKDGETERER